MQCTKSLSSTLVIVNGLGRPPARPQRPQGSLQVHVRMASLAPVPSYCPVFQGCGLADGDAEPHDRAEGKPSKDRQGLPGHMASQTQGLRFPSSLPSDYASILVWVQKPSLSQVAYVICISCFSPVLALQKRNEALLVCLTKHI